eukprot:13461250-Alexandrium_andersonii.AAC.1
MKSHDELQNTRTLYNTYREATEPSSTKEETARAVNILDAKYEKADLPTLVETNSSHLTRDQQDALLKLLQKHEAMFEGTLGAWDGEQIHFDLKPNAMPWRGHPFPVP